jgi:hypothetical protein
MVHRERALVDLLVNGLPSSVPYHPQGDENPDLVLMAKSGD